MEAILLTQTRTVIFTILTFSKIREVTCTTELMDEVSECVKRNDRYGFEYFVASIELYWKQFHELAGYFPVDSEFLGVKKLPIYVLIYSLLFH